MLITDAQREMRTAYMGGLIGQVAAGMILGTIRSSQSLDQPQNWHDHSLFCQYAFVPVNPIYFAANGSTNQTRSWKDTWSISSTDSIYSTHRIHSRRGGNTL